MARAVLYVVIGIIVGFALLGIFFDAIMNYLPYLIIGGFFALWLYGRGKRKGYAEGKTERKFL